MEYFRQCSLQKKNEHQVSWLPEQFAKLGKWLKLRENGIWEDGWQVILVGGRQSRQERIERGNDHKILSTGSDMKRGTRITL